MGLNLNGVKYTSGLENVVLVANLAGKSVTEGQYLSYKLCIVKDKLSVYRVRARCSPALDSFAEQPVLLIRILIATTSEELSIATKNTNKSPSPTGSHETYIIRFIPSYTL